MWEKDKQRLMRKVMETESIETYLLAIWQSAHKRRDFYLGLFTEREKLYTDARRFTKRLPGKDSLERQRERHKWRTHEAEYQCGVQWRTDS